MNRSLPISFSERIASLYRRFSPSANSASDRYSYPAYHSDYGHPSSLIQIAEFSESPFDCPSRGPKRPQRSYSGSSRRTRLCLAYQLLLFGRTASGSLGFLRHGVQQNIFENGESGDSPRAIFRRTIRLSLGRLLPSRACFRFTEPQYSKDALLETFLHFS